MLAKVGAALKEIGDKQIWVQGHTDDQPIFVKKPKPAAPEPAKAKPAKDAKEGQGPPSPIRRPSPRPTMPCCRS